MFDYYWAKKHLTVVYTTITPLMFLQKPQKSACGILTYTGCTAENVNPRFFPTETYQ